MYIENANTEWYNNSNITNNMKTEVMFGYNCPLFVCGFLM